MYNWPEVLCFFRVVFITFCTFSTISFLDASQLANTMSIKTVNRSWSSAGRGPSSLLFMLLLPVLEELIISSVVNSFLKTLSTIFDRGSLGLGDQGHLSYGHCTSFLRTLSRPQIQPRLSYHFLGLCHCSDFSISF